MVKVRRSYLFVCVLMIFSLLVSACGGANTPATEPRSNTKAESPAAEKKLTVKVLDVGQADAILIQTPTQTVLVDSGDVGTKAKLISYIKNSGVRVLDKVIITHAHADHLGGMSEVLNSLTVKQIYDSAYPATTAMYRKYLSTVKEKKIPFARLKSGDTIDLNDGIMLKVLAPGKDFIKGSDSDVNNSSIVAKLIFGEFSMLLTGDAEAESEQQMLKHWKADLESKILKSPHHGSSSSSTAAFLKAISPEAVIISVGKDNEYHHPHPSVMKRYQKEKYKIYRTDIDGTITITSDGQTYQILREKAK